MSHGSNPVKAILFALGANGSLAIAKFLAAIFTGSGSMLAESVHSAADCGNQILLLIGIKQSRKPFSDEFPLGYGKETYFWSFIVALMLFSLGGLFSIYEGWHKIHETAALNYPIVALGVLFFGIIVEGISLNACIQEVNKSRGEQSFWQWFRNTREAELLVIFGEDVAAITGLSLAFIAVTLSWVTGNPVYDAIGSIGIGVLLILVALFVGVEVKSLLIGQGVTPTVRREMIQFLEQHQHIKRLFNLRTLHMGHEVMVAIKAELHEGKDAQRLLLNINSVEVDFRDRFKQVSWCFFEPDLTD